MMGSDDNVVHFSGAVNGSIPSEWPPHGVANGREHSSSPLDSPLAQIRAALPGLTGTARACGESILVNPWAARGIPIGQMAERAGVSENAVNRFSRTLGYRGYRDFSQALVMELGKILGAGYTIPDSAANGSTPEYGPAASQTAVSRVVSGVLAQQLEALHDTARLLDATAVDQAVAAIVAAGTVLLVGTGTGLSIANLVAFRLKSLGLRAAWAGEPGNILAEMHLLGPGDVVCAISLNGVTYHIVDALDRARERGLTTICVTAVPHSPAAKRASIVLQATGPQVRMDPGQFASRMTAVALLEALVAGVAWVTRDTSASHMTSLIEANHQRNRAARREGQRPHVRRPSPDPE